MDIKLFLISDDPVTLAGLKAIIDQDERTTLVGRAADGTSSLRCLEGSAAQPHVIILGEPSSKNAICENVRRIASAYGRGTARPKLLVVSQNDEDDVIIAALRAGVNGYLARIESSDELIHCVQIVAKGGAAFSPTIAARLSRYFSDVQSQPEMVGLADLTSRELEILEFLAGGLSNRQIARRLFLAEKTVRNYVSRIFTKLQVHDRAAAAVAARDAGFGGRTEVALSQSA
jgi:DNA-binding NarL/FixJ family response regulator